MHVLLARPTHAYLDLSPGLDFETEIVVKRRAAELLRAELARSGYRCAVLALGTNTDPYQPVERHHGITRSILEMMLGRRHPVAIITKSARVVRDLDLLASLAAQSLAAVNLSVTTLDARLAAKLEARAAAPQAHLDTLSRHHLRPAPPRCGGLRANHRPAPSPGAPATGFRRAPDVAHGPVPARAWRAAHAGALGPADAPRSRRALLGSRRGDLPLPGAPTSDDFLPDDIRELRDAVVAFMAREVLPALPAHEAAGTFPRDLIRKTGEAGWFGVVFPEALGGTDVGFLAMAVLAEEMARLDPGFALCHNPQAGTCPYTIFVGGTDEQCQRFIPDLIGGRAIGMWSLTEAGGGSDAAGNLKTFAERRGDR